MLIVEFVLVPTWPTADAATSTIIDFYAEHRTGTLLGEYIGGIGAVVFFLWFLGSLRSFLMRAEGAPGRLSSVAFGGGLVAIAIGTLGAATNIVLALQVAEQGDEAVVRAFYLLSNTAFAVFFLPIGVLIGATSIVALRTRALPKWYGQAGGLFFALWLLTTSILLIQASEGVCQRRRLCNRGGNVSSGLANPSLGQDRQGGDGLRVDEPRGP